MSRRVTLALSLMLVSQLSLPVLAGTPVSDQSIETAFVAPIDGPIHLLKGSAEQTEAHTPATPSTDSNNAASPSAVTPSAVTPSPVSPDLPGPGTATTDGLIIIDNDEEKDKSMTVYEWKEIPDQNGKTQIETGARFPVCVLSAHSSKTAKLGDPVEARLKVDIKIGGKLIAPKGSIVTGHVSSCERARKMLKAEFSSKRWMRPSGALGIQFDEMVTPQGDHLPLVAKPARQPRIVNNKSEGRLLGVNLDGQIVSPLSFQVKQQAIHIAIRAGAAAAGPFSFGAVPVAYGVLGAINPSFAFMHPVGNSMRHKRIKGFGLGVMSGLPGGFLVADSIIRGEEAVIQPGDEFLAEFKQTFTGEASSEAQLAPNVKTKVHGEVQPAQSK